SMPSQPRRTRVVIGADGTKASGAGTSHGRDERGGLDHGDQDAHQGEGHHRGEQLAAQGRGGQDAEQVHQDPAVPAQRRLGQLIGRRGGGGGVGSGGRVVEVGGV